MTEKSTGDNQAPNLGSGSDESASKTSLTEEKVNELISKAIGARLKPVQEELKSFKGNFDEIKQLIGGQNKPEAKAEDQTTKAPKLDDHPAFKQMQEQLKKSNERDARRREQVKASALREALLKADVHPDALPSQMALHVSRVQFESEDSDTLVYRVDDADMDLVKGLKAYIDSDPGAKLYLKSKGLNGSGDTNYSGVKTGKSDLDPWRSFLTKK